MLGGRVPEPPPAPRWSHYDTVFYGSSPTCAQGAAQGSGNHAGLGRHSRKARRAPAEYTSASIALRELMHHESGDGSWSSARPDPGRFSVTVQARHPAYQMTVAWPSRRSSAFALSIQGEPATVWVTIAIALALLPGVAVVALSSACSCGGWRWPTSSRGKAG